MLLIPFIEIRCWRPPGISLLTSFPLSSPLTPSHLQKGYRIIVSAEEVQHGDSLGPLLFCLTLHCYCQCLSSDLYVSYLDDVTMGGSCADVLQDLAVVKEAEGIGLILNSSKCEVITWDHTTFGTILTSIPGVRRWTLLMPLSSTLPLETVGVSPRPLVRRLLL